jgi:hypothetical protein
MNFIVKGGALFQSYVYSQNFIIPVGSRFIELGFDQNNVVTINSIKNDLTIYNDLMVRFFQIKDNYSGSSLQWDEIKRTVTEIRNLCNLEDLSYDFGSNWPIQPIDLKNNVDTKKKSTINRIIQIVDNATNVLSSNLNQFEKCLIEYIFRPTKSTCKKLLLIIKDDDEEYMHYKYNLTDIMIGFILKNELNLDDTQFLSHWSKIDLKKIQKVKYDAIQAAFSLINDSILIPSYTSLLLLLSLLSSVLNIIHIPSSDSVKKPCAITVLVFASLSVIVSIIMDMIVIENWICSFEEFKQIDILRTQNSKRWDKLGKLGNNIIRLIVSAFLLYAVTNEDTWVPLFVFIDIKFSIRMIDLLNTYMKKEE